MNTEHDWTVWWHDEGSGMRPKGGQDHESHVRDMTRIAWLNGAFGAADEIERLRAELADVCRKSAQALVELSSNLCVTSARERERLTAERDEARRLLKAVVDMMRDNMAHDATHPHHLCDFIHRHDIGMCKVCEDWTDAMVMCYPDDFQDEEDGK